MKIAKATALAIEFSLGLFISPLASASVIYEWKTLSTSSTIWMAAGRIEITDAAWRARNVSYQVPPIVWDSTIPFGYSYADPASPLIRFSFTINQPQENPMPAIDVNVHRGTGLYWPIDGWLSADFSITGRKMDLSLYVNDQNSDMRLMHNAITRFGSDAPYYGECAFHSGCDGAAGEWIQVPEPAVGALLGIGLFGIACLRTRKRSLKSPLLAG